MDLPESSRPMAKPASPTAFANAAPMPSIRCPATSGQAAGSATVTDVGRQLAAVQSSQARPATRANSTMLAVTRMARIRSACAAVRRS